MVDIKDPAFQHKSKCAEALDQIDQFFQERAKKEIFKKDMVQLKCEACGCVESREMYCPYTGQVFNTHFTYTCLTCGDTMHPLKYYSKLF
jgi:hypothetical protein